MKKNKNESAFLEKKKQFYGNNRLNVDLITPLFGGAGARDTNKEFDDFEKIAKAVGAEKTNLPNLVKNIDIQWLSVSYDSQRVNSIQICYKITKNDNKIE